jgi:hypothetical protein
MEPWLAFACGIPVGLLAGYLFWGPSSDPDPVVTPPDEPPAPETYTPFSKEPEIPPSPTQQYMAEHKRSHHKSKEDGGVG